MGSKVAGRALLLLLCLAVGDAVRQASMHKDIVDAAQKQEQERIEHEHVQQGHAEEVADSELEWGWDKPVYTCGSTRECQAKIGPACYCSSRKCHC
mmetsp:Transcript_72500/g.169940  ORF Transcript_72500/g.169940 Transcript_72500/m.169940 type:complete len:96 (-) Transcript_72500:101-388(-)|eukprot:s3319_g6.t1